MRKNLKFIKLSLLSQKERRGFQIDLSAPRIVLVAGNGFGKSVIVKSLYEALGAKPHKIDQYWRGASVTSLLEFEIDGTPYSSLKVGDTYTISDGDKRPLITTSHVVSELGPFVGRMIDFHLVLANRKQEIVTPPPSFAFAPFYMDQDQSWQKTWTSFNDLGMFGNSAKSLSEYHSGLRPNAFYDSKAERDSLRFDLTKTDGERKAVDQAVRKVRESMPATPLALTLTSFEEDTDRLVAEGQKLHNEQCRYRQELSDLHQEYHLWADQVAVIQTAIAEIDETFIGALEHPADVECPMCGQHYHNQIADRFDLVADKDDLLQALLMGRRKVTDLDQQIAEQKKKLETVSAAIDKVQQVLAIHKQDISLRDVVAAEGRSEAQRVLTERLAVLDEEYGEKQRRLADAEERMKQADSKTRRKQIKHYFATRLSEFGQELDVRLPEKLDSSLQGLNIGRGSEGPRGLAAYYYAFLHTAHEYGSSAFCPIVIDAPIQQGQDQIHLQQIMKLLLEKPPTSSQVIIAIETMDPVANAKIVDVAFKKHNVLREDQFDAVREYVRPFLQQNII